MVAFMESCWKQDGSAVFLLEGIACIAVIWTISIIAHRLLLSPLAKFPGPKIAAATSWYEAYYDVVHQGKYLFEIERMHDKYGPIVRINPYELSIRDPDFHDQLYVARSVRRTDKYRGFVEGVVDFEGSHLATVGHDLHRRRRKPLDPYFSRQGITKLESMIADLVERLVVERFGEMKGEGRVVRLDHAFTAFSGDVICRVCVDDPLSLIEEEDFAPWWCEMFRVGILSMPLFMAMPWLIRVIRLIPLAVLARLGPRAETFTRFKAMWKEHLQVARAEKADIETKAAARPTLFRHLLSSDLPASELSDERVLREAQALIGAGTITTAGTLCFLCYHIMANPAVKARMQAELGPVMVDYPLKKPSWAELEKLPFFQAVIREGLRLSYGTMHRRPRVSPDRPIQFQDWIIPAGVPVSMSAYFQHRNAEIFPQPLEFLPERWLENVTPAMNRNFIPFSKGSRNCLGMSLAYCEINLVLAALFRPGGLDFDLYDTNVTDVTPVHDLIIPLPKLDSWGPRIIIR